MSHVTGGVYVNQGTNASYNQQHDHGETVNRKIKTNVQRARRNPSEIMFHVGFVQWGQGAEGFEHPKKRQHHAAHGNGVNDSF